MIKDFGFIIPQNCQFGMGALKKLPDFLKAAGSDNVMLISDRGLEAIGVVDKVREIIKAADLKYSEYLDVLLELCDRIMVLCGGKVTGIVPAQEVTKEQLGLMMTGASMEEAMQNG